MQYLDAVWRIIFARANIKQKNKTKHTDAHKNPSHDELVYVPAKKQYLFQESVF